MVIKDLLEQLNNYFNIFNIINKTSILENNI